MSAEIIDGESLAADVREEVAADVRALVESGERAPHLTAVLVGDDPASHSYVRGKARDCEAVGMSTDTIVMPADSTMLELLPRIAELNANSFVNGVIIQMPLPPQLDEQAAMAALDPNKDADGLHANSLGLLLQGTPHFIPATPIPHFSHT